MPSRIRVAIHLHTNYSHDSNVSPRQLVEAAAAEALDCIAITDHDEIDGAVEAAAVGAVQVIIGQEVSTRDGHLIGLFLRERVRPGLSALDTVDRIRAQGGVVLAPHPYCALCDSSLGRSIDAIAHELDGVEVCNSQNPLPWQDRAAARFARAHGLNAYVGADGHLRGRVAPGYQVMRPFRGPADFVAALAEAELHAGRFGPWYLARMAARHFWDKISPTPLPGFGANWRGGAAAEAGASEQRAA